MTQVLTEPIHNLPIVTGNMAHYVQMAHSLPVLTAEEEYALAQRLREEGDVEAARELVLRNLRFVIHVARGYAGYGLPMEDLVQEGSIGLMKAVKRYDPTVGVRLVSFAVHWIRAEIHEYVLRNWRIVKMATTKAQRKLFFNLRKAKKRLGWMNQEEVNTVAKDLGVTAKEVRDMENRLNSPDMPMDVDSDDEHGPRSPLTYLAAPDADPAQTVESEDYTKARSESLHFALEGLDERAQEIVKRRWLGEKKATLHQLAEEYGVSAERVRQIEAAAMKKMRQALA